MKLVNYVSWQKKIFNTYKLSAIFIIFLMISACSSSSFTGDWVYEGMDIRDEKPLLVTVVKLENKKYYVEVVGADFAGEYKLSGKNELAMVKPTNPRMHGFKLKVSKNHITIIDQPNLNISKKKYLGGQFRRRD